MEPQQYRVLADTHSAFNPRCCYAKKGAIVPLIKADGHVSTVQRQDGERFSILTESIILIQTPN